MNRRFFAKHATGFLAAIGVGAKAEAVVVKNERSQVGPGIDECYGCLLPEKTPPVVQDDGCTYSAFQFAKALGGKAWRLKWIKTAPDGTKYEGAHYMAGCPKNIVKVDIERYKNG